MLSSLKCKSVLITVVAVFLCAFGSVVYGQPWDGNGVDGDPYLIYDANDMQAIGADANYWDKHFVLVNDINLANYSGEEFNVIGTGIPFTGVFDGNGHTISNFTYAETLQPWPILNPTLDHTDQGFNTSTNINNMFSDDFVQHEPILIPLPNDINHEPIVIPFPNDIDINWAPFEPPPSFGGDGLFASVDGADAVIKNLTLVDPNIKTFGGSIGALVGHLHNGIVSNCGVEGGIVHKIVGGIIGLGPSCLGGLVGYISDGNVSGCYVSDCYLINQSWAGSAGGLTACNEAGTISNCYAIDSVVTDGILISGGLVTFNAGIILNSYVIGSENESGLVGTNTGTISNCHTSGSSQWAGLVCANSGTILNSYTTGIVNGNYAGGLVSINDGDISNCYTTCAVDGNNYTGGLVGYNDGTISNCYAAGPVAGNVNVGGLVGYDDGGSYVSCFWDSDVNPDANGIENVDEPNVVGLPTVLMQTESTFTDAGWDFVGEVVNGTEDIWQMCDLPDYPKLWWQECPVVLEMEITPAMLNCESEGNWVKAHVILPEGYWPEDIDVNTPAVAKPMGVESEYITVFDDGEGEFGVEIGFDREAFCAAGLESKDGYLDVTVTGWLLTGERFEGTDTIKVISQRWRHRHRESTGKE